MTYKLPTRNSANIERKVESKSIFKGDLHKFSYSFVGSWVGDGDCSLRGPIMQLMAVVVLFGIGFQSLAVVLPAKEICAGEGMAYFKIS